MTKIYGDEEIIRRRVAAEAKRRHTIENKVEIDGVEYMFARRKFEFGFSMVVPEAFEQMPREIAKRKFPYEDRPEIIISNSDYRVCIAFNNAELGSESIDSRVSSFRAYIKTIHPSNVFFIQGIYDLPNNIQIGHYDYRYPVVNNDLYNITFVADLPDMELLGWFICPIDVKDKWEPLARQMIQSIELVERGV